MENGVKLLKGLLRVHVLSLERKLGHRVPSKHPMMSWLVEHVADVATKYLRGIDGRTAYERLFGKQIHEEGLEFGEKVLWKQRANKDMNVLLEARWTEASGWAATGAHHTIELVTASLYGKPGPCNAARKPNGGAQSPLARFEPRHGATRRSQSGRNRLRFCHRFPLGNESRRKF